MPVIMASHYKGGTGKSSVAVNLAAAFQRLRYDTVIVDIDASTQTAFEWRRSYRPVGEEESPLPKVILLEGDVADQILRLSRLYEVVVVDAGAGNTVENRSAVKVADFLLVPVAPSGFEVLPTLKYAAEIAGIQALNKGRPAARLVLNRIAPRKASSADLVAVALSPSCAVKPLKAMVPARTVMEQLNTAGVSVFEYPRSGDLKDIFLSMAQEVTELLAMPLPRTGTQKSKSKAA